MIIRLVSIAQYFDILQGMDFDIYQIPHMESKSMNRHTTLQQENQMHSPEVYSIAKSCG